MASGLLEAAIDMLVEDSSERDTYAMSRLWSCPVRRM